MVSHSTVLGDIYHSNCCSIFTTKMISHTTVFYGSPLIIKTVQQSFERFQSPQLK